MVQLDWLMWFCDTKWSSRRNGTTKWHNSNAQSVRYTRRHNCISLHYI